jgi:hypothetical protein
VSVLAVPVAALPAGPEHAPWVVEVRSDGRVVERTELHFGGSAMLIAEERTASLRRWSEGQWEVRVLSGDASDPEVARWDGACSPRRWGRRGVPARPRGW